MDRALHKRYLDYREAFECFGKKKAMLTADEFAQADSELQALVAKGKKRDEGEERRKSELDALLFRN
jgi:hypothetical protein